MTETDYICWLADEIRGLIFSNIKKDGNCLFDPVKVKLALEFTKQEIEKSIQAGINLMD